MKRTIKIPWIILLLLLFGIAVKAQVKVQVLSKKVTKNLVWADGQSLIINAEHADIICTTHAQNSIVLELTITAKHENKERAEEDLYKMKWLSETKGNKIFLRNYVELSRGESRPESSIKVTYNLKVPEGCALNIRNSFGSINVKNVKAGLKINSEYSKITLENVGGKTDIETLFGDVTWNGLSGEASVNSNRSDINLSGLSGNVELNASIAEIRLRDFKDVKQLNIKAEKSVIDLIIPLFDHFAYSLDLSDCEFSKPENMLLELPAEKANKIVLEYQANQNKPLVSISLTYGSLAINP
ncbi:MAG: DUF4097 family beta strand repeat protein [Bacteroidales bacterium]|nr:DUF4097 family beta strand repeat protein [Bacteroidales bacterium]